MRRLLVVALMVGLVVAAAPGARAGPGASEGSREPKASVLATAPPLPDLPDVAPPAIDDPISEAELQDLQTLASQLGISLQAAIDRYAWNDNFALAVARIREALPEEFTAAGILGAHHAWVAFSGDAAAAREMIDAFGSAHSGVSVDVRTGLGFTEMELEKAIETVHFTVLASPDVRDAATSYDLEAGEITTNVVMDSTVSDFALDDLRAAAVRALTHEVRAGILDTFTIFTVRSMIQHVGGTESNIVHLGGETLSDCTSAFGTISSAGVTGIATAGHCGNSQSDDGFALTFKDDYQGTHGDFQWHTGPKPEPDDFYSGSASSTEVYRRDVSNIGSPVVGQSLCRNGWTSHKDCQEVRKVGVCDGNVCNLVEMGAHLSASGDSGGPVFWGNTAYGIHRGWIYDPWPFGREVFSRADRIDNALGIFINS